MFTTQKSNDKLKAELIKILGQKEYESNLIDIADMLNDLDYKETKLSIKAAASLIQEIITDKTKKYWRQIFKNEFANLNHHRPPQYRKWRWMSSSEKLNFLEIIKQKKVEGVSWSKLKKLLHISAVDLVHNILYGKVYANKLQMKLAHDIWELGEPGKKIRSVY